MKIKLIPAWFDRDAFARIARENKSWADLDDDLKGRVKPKPTSFKIIGPSGKYTLIKWDNGDKEYCTELYLKRYRKKFKETGVYHKSEETDEEIHFGIGC